MVLIFECNIGCVEWEVICVSQVERRAHNLSRFELNSTCYGNDLCVEENQYNGGIS